MRFAAAAGVVLYHFTFFGPASGLMPKAATALDGVTRYGGLGVNLFFIISGFVILMSAQHSTPRQFAVARAVRLYPAYWICCTATYLGLLVLPHPAFSVSFGQYLANLTMVSPLAGIDYLDGVYWSLLVELHFYLLVFLLLLTGLLAHTRALLGLWLAIALLDHFDIVETYATNQLFFTDWSGYFIAGAMFYLVRQRRRWDAYAVAVLCGSCLMVIQKALAVSAVETRDLGAGMDPTMLTVVLVAFFVLFALIASDRTVALRSAAFGAAGRPDLSALPAASAAGLCRHHVARAAPAPRPARRPRHRRRDRGRLRGALAPGAPARPPAPHARRAGGPGHRDSGGRASGRPSAARTAGLSAANHASCPRGDRCWSRTPQ